MAALRIRTNYANRLVHCRRGLGDFMTDGASTTMPLGKYVSYQVLLAYTNCITLVARLSAPIARIGN